MKIDKKNIRHWYYLFLFTFNVLTALFFLPFFKKRTKRIVLYGHKLNGNIAALYNYGINQRPQEYEYYVLCFDSQYCASLRDTGVNALSATKWKDIFTVCRANIIVTDHGPHALFFLNIFTSTIFIDVWHGIPYKCFGENEFFYIRRYTAVFVASPKMRELYVQKFGIPGKKIYVTGYGRTDKLVTGRFSRKALITKYNLPKATAYILYAPTWSHEMGQSDLGACGVRENEFLAFLEKTTASIGACLLLRAHVNALVDKNVPSSVVRLPAEEHPDTEEILFISDVLLTDWSSIAFDYLLLLRPTIFLERRVPFANGFSLGPQYRFGCVIADIDSLEKEIRLVIGKPEQYMSRRRLKMLSLAREIYGDYADGESSVRYFQTIQNLA